MLLTKWIIIVTAIIADVQAEMRPRGIFARCSERLERYGGGGKN